MRMKRKTTFRLAAAALAMTQLVTAAASAAFTNGFSWSYPVGEGLTYTRTEGKNTAGVQRANVLTYEPNTGVSPVMVYAGDTVYGSKATITNAVKYLQNQGKTVIGGTNADFFVMSSGVPIGLVIDKGTLVSSDAWQYAVGFKKDGTAVIGRPTMGIRITGASGSCSVSYFNKTRTTAGAYLLDRNYDEATHFAAKGSYIVLEREDSTQVKAGGSVRLKVVSKGTGSSSFAIGENQMVLTKSPRGSISRSARRSRSPSPPQTRHGARSNMPLAASCSSTTARSRPPASMPRLRAARAAPSASRATARSSCTRSMATSPRSAPA